MFLNLKVFSMCLHVSWAVQFAVPSCSHSDFSSGVSQPVQVLLAAARLRTGLAAAGTAMHGRRWSPGHWAWLTDC